MLKRDSVNPRTSHVPLCRKHRYRTKWEAQMALDGIAEKAHNKPKRRECRIYECPICRAWHLTSMPLARPEEARS